MSVFQKHIHIQHLLTGAIVDKTSFNSSIV